MHIIKVCTGCSCERNFGNDVLRRAEKILGIQAGETTEDGQFRLEKTGCLSHCEEAPNVLFCKADGPLAAVMIDGEVETNCLPHRFEKKLNELKSSNQ